MFFLEMLLLLVGKLELQVAEIALDWMVLGLLGFLVFRRLVFKDDFLDLDLWIWFWILGNGIVSHRSTFLLILINLQIFNL
jgi:hypothetical protein